jgi:alkanesulfonate monooxygenase SsuD/methylene tetrahydromethanopterin reductase-like flavin-dependent oxidoreductase (luciferase family)
MFATTAKKTPAVVGSTRGGFRNGAVLQDSAGKPSADDQRIQKAGIRLRTGMSFFFMGSDRLGSDQDIYCEEVKLASMAEPLGFDSLWATEHHFTEYSMIPNPLVFLAHMAGKTERVTLGAMVVVLPWHNPARLAGEITMLDNLSGGRFCLGVGRGLGRLEFEGLGVEMSSSREVFDESADVLLGALESGYIEATGAYLTIPRREIRPRPTASFVGRTYGAAVSPESVKAMARIGAGLIIIPQKPWETVVQELEIYRDEFATHHPDRDIPAPIVAVHTYCSSDGEKAAERAGYYNERYFHRVMEHYDLGGTSFASQKGYDYYAKVSARITSHGKDDAAQFYSDLHVHGTPVECAEKIRWIKETTQCDTVLNFFSYSGMPFQESKDNLCLYAEKVLPSVRAM